MYWVAINASGVVLAGAQNGDGAFQDQGSAYLFRPDATGSYTALKLTASDGAAGDRFGVSVALNNAGVAVVGSHYDVTDSNVRTGSAYVYRPDGQGGYYETKLVPPDGVSGGQFGYAVSINDAGVIAVGSYLDNAKAAKSGSVYVYRPDGFGGYAVTKVTASDGAAGDQFGNSVTMTESGRLIVGAYMDDTTVNDTGAVYIYEFTAPGSVASEVKLLASDGATGDEFGLRTASNAAGVIVVSAHLADNGGVLDSGAVYVYTPNGFGGYTEKKLSALDEFAGDGFGYSIAINDDGVIVAGALWNDDAGSNSGSAYVFVPDGLGGYTQFKLTAHDGQAGDLFGRSVSINSDGVVTVAAQLGDGAAVNSGAVYTFVPNADGNYVGSNGTVYQGVP
ncbi:FG-GAP repeat protein, partial [Pannonibacter phragmitetus]